MKTLIVTGASSGIGREFAETLSRMTDVEEVWVIARRADRLEELKTTINKTVIAISLDLSDYSCIEKYKNMLSDRSPEVVALVNAAGYGRFGEVENVTLSDQVGMIDLNAMALTQITYLTLTYMESGGQIYQVASISGLAPVPYLSVYAATKAYVLSFSRALNVELKHRGIRVMAVCPFWTRTEFFDRAAQQNDVVVHYARFYTPAQVVERAVKDMKRKKDVSICGAYARFLGFGMRFLPQRLTMRIWCKQQKK